MFQNAVEMSETLVELKRENFFSKRRVEDMQTPTVRNSLHSPQSETHAAPRKGRYGRYMEEREEQERLALAQAAATRKKIDEAVFDMSAIFDKLNKLNGVLKNYYDADDPADGDAGDQETIVE